MSYKLRIYDNNGDAMKEEYFNSPIAMICRYMELVKVTSARNRPTAWFNADYPIGWVRLKGF